MIGAQFADLARRPCLRIRDAHIADSFGDHETRISEARAIRLVFDEVRARKTYKHLEAISNGIDDAATARLSAPSFHREVQHGFASQATLAGSSCNHNPMPV